jgi:uncharacterized protein YabE (DUF348 family)
LWVLATERKKDRSPLPFLALTSILVAVLATSCVAVALAATKSVEVVAWDRQIRLITTAKSVKQALAEAGVVLGPGDSCVPGPDVPLKSGIIVTILRAEPVFVVQGGNVIALLTSEKGVDAILAEAGVSPGPDDVVVPGAGQEVPESHLVKVVKVTYGEVVQSEEIPFSTETREDSLLEAGLYEVYGRGVPGEIRVTYKVRYEDGVEASRQEVSREELEAPSPQILLVGTLREISRGGNDIRFRTAIEVLSTAYCPCTKCCGPSAKGVTRTGLPAKKGVIAVDPRVIPLGSRVYVDGYGFAVAADTGSAIKGDRIDVCFDTHQEALVWGMRWLKIYILE